MAKTILVATGTEITYGAAAARFCSCYTSNISSRAQENLSQTTYNHAGTFSNLWVRVTVNGSTTASTVNLRIDGVNANQTVSIGAGAGAIGTFEDTTHTDTITAGQKIGYVINSGATAGPTIRTISIIFSPSTTTNTVSRLAADIGAGAAFSAASSSRFMQLVGEMSSGVTAETSGDTYFQTVGTLKNLEVAVRDNARTTTTTVRTRKNGANGAQSISIAGSPAAIGLFQDTTNSDTIADGDRANYAVVTGTGTEVLTIEHVAVDFITTTGTGFTSYARTGAFAQAEPSTRFPMIGGNAIVGMVTGEPNSQVKTRVPFTFSKLTANVTANAITDTTTVTFRKNTADGNQTISIGSSAIGRFTDLTGTDVCDADDLVCLQSVTPAVTGTPSITIRNFSLLYTSPPPTTTVNQTSIQEYNLNQYVTSANVNKYHLLQYVAIQSSIQEYNILFSILANNIHKYNLASYVTRDSIHKFNLLAYATRSSIHKYHALMYTAVQANIHKYGILQYAAKSSNHLYRVLQKTLQSSIHKYNSLVYVLGLDAVHRYNILQNVITSSIHKYAILNQILKSSIHKYNLLQYAMHTYIHRYASQQYVLHTYILNYDIEAIGAVVTSYILKYNLLAHVSRSNIQKYGLLNSVLQSSIHKYALLQRAIQLSINKYSLFSSVIRTNIHKYNSLAAILQTNIHRYDLEAAEVAATILNTIHKYNIASYITAKQSIQRYGIGTVAKKLVSMIGPNVTVELTKAANIVLDKIKGEWPS